MKVDSDPRPVPIRSREELSSVFRAAERAAQTVLVGAEAEKFVLDRSTFSPAPYDGPRGVRAVLEALAERYGYEKYFEVPEGPLLGLSKEGRSITLEPGAQLELSGKAHADLHAVAEEAELHAQELAPILSELDLGLAFVGFHPTAKLEALPWVMKQRYPIMRSYLPEKGAGAHDMMQRTATVQGNFDWTSERDAMNKLTLALRLSPLIHAMFANSPFREGRLGGLLSERGQVWLKMDPSRSGLIPRFWTRAEPEYEDYVEWSLDAGMFLIRRGDAILKNTGQTFRDFLENGFQGERATLEDYKLHLSTLFPEVRMKSTLEVRSADSLAPDLALSLIALWTGLLYDGPAREQARALVQEYSFEFFSDHRPELIRDGLRAACLGRDGFSLGLALVAAARGGLERRKRLNPEGRSEAIYLRPIEKLLEQGRHPADLLIERLQAGGVLGEICLSSSR